MGKVITVWGSPGSGKSMFCCILAKALTRDKRKAIIINADMNVPKEIFPAIIPLLFGSSISPAWGSYLPLPRH